MDHQLKELLNFRLECLGFGLGLMGHKSLGLRMLTEKNVFSLRLGRNAGIQASGLNGGIGSD